MGFIFCLKKVTGQKDQPKTESIGWFTHDSPSGLPSPSFTARSRLLFIFGSEKI
jgi:hypothetical protein